MKKGELRALIANLREFALSLPGAYEEFPWGETVVKVNKKVFVFLGKSENLSEECGFSVKLPESKSEVLELPFAEPAGYGLGKSGWVSIRLSGEVPSTRPLFRSWIEESYRSIAPKKLAAQLDSKPAK